MIDFSAVTISKLIFHRISTESYKCLVNDQLFGYKNEEEEQVLKNILLKPFATGMISHEFKHEITLDLNPLFKISKEMVKKQARIFKSVLKLDKNFHVYIHGNTNLIEKGYDEHVGKHFYKIYFDEES